jgi:ribonuclease HI
MIFTNSDGGSRGNPGLGAIGVIVRDGEKILTRYSEKIGKFVTNNIAEYEALIKALELATRYTKDELTCFLDSELVVNQLLGKYRVRKPELLKLFLKVQKLQENFKSIKYQYVSRENKFQILVDEILNDELDKK